MPRGKAEALVAGLGAEASSSVTRKVTYVVAGADPGSKLQKAENYGITVLDEDGFLSLLARAWGRGLWPRLRACCPLPTSYVLISVTLAACSDAPMT